MSLSLASWARQPIGSIRILVVSFAFSWVPSLGPKIPKDGCFEWSIYKTSFISNNKRVNEAILLWTKWRHLFGLPQKALRFCILHAFNTRWVVHVTIVLFTKWMRGWRCMGTPGGWLVGQGNQSVKSASRLFPFAFNCWSLEVKACLWQKSLWFGQLGKATNRLNPHFRLFLLLSTDCQAWACFTPNPERWL